MEELRSTIWIYTPQNRFRGRIQLFALD